METILISVISMLADPNDESPANVDAAKEWREAYPEFKYKYIFYILKINRRNLLRNLTGLPFKLVKKNPDVL